MSNGLLFFLKNFGFRTLNNNPPQFKILRGILFILIFYKTVNNESYSNESLAWSIVRATLHFSVPIVGEYVVV